MQEFTFTNTCSFVTALAMLKQDGAWFLPKWTEEFRLSADGYLALRDQWEKDGVAVLDFDGELHPTRRFARLSYNIIKARAALRYEKDGGEQLFLLGPVDGLSVSRSGETWRIALCSPTEISHYVRENLGRAEQGVLMLRAWKDGELLQSSAGLTGSEAQQTLLEQYLDVFFGRRVETDARDSNRDDSLE